MKGKVVRNEATNATYAEESETTDKKKKILTRLDMTKNGAAPGRSRKRFFHLKTLQTIPEGIDAFAEGTLAWIQGLANESEAELCLKADIVPLVNETMNEDGTTNVKLIPTPLLETRTTS